jgi:hypothetical protein
MGPPAVLRREPFFRPANWLWEKFLRWSDLWAIPMPWRTVHIRRDIYRYGPVLDTLCQHERVHYEQMERMGTILWHIHYFCLLARYGYRNNPYEIEAYSRYAVWMVQGQK